MDFSGITSTYNQYLNTQAKDALNKKMENVTSKDYSNATDEELMDVCKQFEAYFLEQVFKQMDKTVIKADDSTTPNSNLVDYFKGTAIQDLAAQSTEKNGLGIAQMLYENMKNMR
ncbi:MAG: rod-binding protein [Lachnospiraceae bacterium]|nr:rod-binding protein [Lachnospiraceae bacterium]